MTIIPASHLTAHELNSLGNNVAPLVQPHEPSVPAVNRSLHLHGELVERLYRRHGSSKLARLRHQSRAS